MLNHIIKYKTKYIWIFGWIALWLLPWGEWFSSEENFFLTILSDILRLSLAIVLFILPGIFLFILLSPQKNPLKELFALIPIGFTLSTLLIGLIGLFGKILGFSFEFVKFIFALLGFAEILVIMKIRPGIFQQKLICPSKIRDSLTNPPLLGALFLGNLMLFNNSLFFIDDWTYLAYLTNWQESTSLNFNEIIYGVNATDAARFWLALYPMGQALLSDLSNIPGILLLGNYLEFFLVPIAILSLYFFARKLGLSKQAAGFSVLAQIAFLCWLVGSEQNRTGMWFFQSMSEDKVTATFILAPVLFSFVVMYVKEPVLRNLVLVFLVGVSITLTHPVILFFCAFIVGGLVLIEYLIRRLSGINLVKILLVIIIWILPFIPIRFLDHPSMNTVAYNARDAEETLTIERHIDIREDGQYGIPIDVLKFVDLQLDAAPNPAYQFFRFIPLVIMFAAGFIGLLHIRRGFIYAYLFVSTILIVLAIVPITGQLLGYVVSARMIVRSSWFAPLGIGLAMIVKTVLDLIRSRRSIDRESPRWSKKITQGAYARIYTWGIAFILMFGLGSPTMLIVVRNVPNLADTIRFYKQIGELGKYISSNNTEKVSVITLNGTDNFLPGISANAKPISFRDESNEFVVKYVLAPQDLIDRQKDSKIMQSLDAGIPLDDRLALFDKYEIKYVLADTKQAQTYLEILNQNNQRIDAVYQTEDYVLFKVFSQ